MSVHTAWTVHKITVFFWLACTAPCWITYTSIAPHPLYLWHSSFFEWIFHFCLLAVHLFVYPLLWWPLGNGRTVLENCTTEHRDGEGEAKRVITLNYLIKIMFQHINSDTFRLQFMVHSCRSVSSIPHRHILSYVVILWCAVKVKKQRSRDLKYTIGSYVFFMEKQSLKAEAFYI